MFFQSIDINNYGNIEDFHYQFRFDENGHPIPLVLIGENGTGKTLTVANMVDSLIEIKRKAYGENLFEVKNYNYFKIGSKSYISDGQNSSRVSITLKHNDKELKYIDIMSKDPGRISADSFVSVDEIPKHSVFEESGFSKTAVSSLKKKDYSDFINLYFPVDRFYLPMWYNVENYKRIDYSMNNMINLPNTNIVKVDILSNIEEWLKSVYFQSTYQIYDVPDNSQYPEHLWGKQITILVDTDIQSAIKTVINTTLGVNDYRVGPIDRRNPKVGFSVSGIKCDDISQLSEGQMSLLAIALSIIKEWDVTHTSINLEEINGCVIIDEADLGLHINYMHDCFPRMMKLFPNVQFVLTTHSPFLVDGLFKTYGDDIDVLTMPEGLRITDANAFGEVQRAQELIFEGINQIREEDKQLKNEIEQLHQHKAEVVVYTEGETDVLLINKAIEKLSIDDISLDVRVASQNNGKHGDDVTKKLLLTLKENPCHNNIVIGLFDRDANPAVEFVDETGKKHKLVNQDFVKLGKQLYAFALPVPHNRPEVDQISIEHYFTDEEIMTENENHQRLFLGNEFYSSGNHIDDSKDYNYRNIKNYENTIRIIEHENNVYVTDRKGNGDYSLSKQRFAEAVSNDRPGFDKFDFSEFSKIFDVIRRIINNEQNS